MGSDSFAGKPFALRDSFNPRSRMGSDPTFPDYGIDAKYVSIHAPAWGATLLNLDQLQV